MKTKITKGKIEFEWKSNSLVNIEIEALPLEKMTLDEEWSKLFMNHIIKTFERFGLEVVKINNKGFGYKKIK